MLDNHHLSRETNNIFVTKLSLITMKLRFVNLRTSEGITNDTTAILALLLRKQGEFTSTYNAIHRPYNTTK